MKHIENVAIITFALFFFGHIVYLAANSYCDQFGGNLAVFAAQVVAYAGSALTVRVIDWLGYSQYDPI